MIRLLLPFSVAVIIPAAGLRLAGDSPIFFLEMSGRLGMMRNVLIALTGALALVGATGRAQPRLEVADGTKFTLGTIYRGQVIDRKLTIRNTGSDTLVIDNVSASCGCTGAMVSSPRLAPGESGTLSITFNSKNFTGEVHKTVTVHSNSSRNRAEVIEFSAKVLDEIAYTPLQFWFKDAEVGKVSRSIVKLKNKADSPLTLTSCRLTAEGFALKLPSEPLPPGAEVDLVMEFTPKKAVSFIAEGVFLQTSSPHQPEIYIPVYGSSKEFKFE
jgi:hypothetical protein